MTKMLTISNLIGSNNFKRLLCIAYFCKEDFSVVMYLKQEQLDAIRALGDLRPVTRFRRETHTRGSVIAIYPTLKEIGIHIPPYYTVNVLLKPNKRKSKV